MIELWTGSANTWDCDEMGHMNVRIYVEKAMEGLGALALAMQLPGAFQSTSPSTIIPQRHHIRFIREVMPGRPLSMKGCVLDHGEDWVEVYQEMRHSDGAPAAAIRTRLVHATTTEHRRFPWSKRTLKALKQLNGEPPADTAPRSLDLNAPFLPDAEATKAVADAAGVPVIGRGMFGHRECDAFGSVWAPWFMGRVSDSVPNLLYDWRVEVARERPMGAAVLEYRLIYRAWPRAGDLFEVRTGLARVAEKTHSLVHWILDPESGRPWVTSEAVAVTFDLEHRKVIATPAKQIARLEELAPRGLSV